MNQQDFEAYIERLQNAFSITGRKFAAEMAEKGMGLTGPQFFILNVLSKKGRCTVTELAEDMMVKPSAITTMVDRLYKSGLVLRKRDESDRRVVYIQLSDLGAETFEKVRLERKRTIQRHLSHLEPEELKLLVQLFEKIAGIVTEQHDFQEKKERSVDE
ncbi:DNA-binding MarR family transcriptional regulator [Anoxybacillus calidus]|uniref:DNA-binding MarR family transcriptional regulator n=1 Tax=[Anoxybacillus] calidus TaxID=575178 RepID=A0A7V9Z132_9BACL|nr:MarR family transcriptional regulator [Anoxybacillus calidus]MBA2871955.1 DNA-binding MarR family transcriptional regulator [Anoxybacillus calidus]